MFWKFTQRNLVLTSQWSRLIVEKIVMSQTFETELNVCYEVLLYLAWLMQKLPAGEVLEFIASDPNAETEIAEWVELRGYKLVAVETLENRKIRFLIRR